LSRRRISAAASVVAQAKARAAAAPNTAVPLIPETAQPDARGKSSVLHARIDDTPDIAAGAPRLRVIVPGKRAPEVYDLSRLLVQPKIARFLAEGFRQWASGRINARTRAVVCRNLNTDVGAFLATLKGQVLLRSIDEAFWTSFIVWINGPRSQGGQPWAHATRAKVLRSFKVCIDSLEGHPEHGTVATYLRDKSGFPRNRWPGLSTKRVATPVLSPPQRRAMILACLGEIGDLRERLEERDAILETGCALLEGARAKEQEPPYLSDIGVCAARIAEAFPDRLASLDDVYALDRSLSSAVRRHGMVPVRRLLYATFRDLVPFVLLIGIKTAFNANTILSLTWSRVRVSDEGTTVTFLGVKSRAAGLQASITPDDGATDRDFSEERGVRFGLVELLAHLRRLTERSRAILVDRI
jgi:hypothetical protein